VQEDEKAETSAEKDEDKAAAADDSAVKEPEPDFTVTPSKDGQLFSCLYILFIMISYNSTEVLTVDCTASVPLATVDSLCALLTFVYRSKQQTSIQHQW